MKQIILFIVIFCVLHVVQSSIEILPLKTPREIKPEQCREPGLGCAVSATTSHCPDTVIMCADRGNGHWHVSEVEKCDVKEDSGNYSCINGACVNKFNLSCLKQTMVKFPCTSAGIFPDPFDCQAFHICSKAGELSDGERCDGDHMYDPLSTYCKLELPEGGCRYGPLPGCDGSKPVSENKSIYRICSYLTIESKESRNVRIKYPKMFICPNGRTFSNGTCN